MQTVLITGSNGFIGRNLAATLKTRPHLTLLLHDIDNSRSDLLSALDQADIVFHLAGVNRPHDPKEFETGNAGLTRDICAHLIAAGKSPALVLSSSIQADLDNPYGISKRQAEEDVRAYAEKSGASIAVYRLPNVFGKGCRPNYNSAVATFCHNIAHGLEITVRDPAVQLSLVYIDDLVEEFIRALEGNPTRHDAYCTVPVVTRVTLGRIVELLHAFKSSRQDLQIPNQADPFTKKLYATYLSYLPPDQFRYPLNMHVDPRGSFTECFKSPDRGQISVNISKPGITKGNHWHHTKNEKFLVVSGRGVIRFRKLGDPVVHEYAVSGETLEVVDIPPGYTHNIENLGDHDLVTVMWACEAFDPSRPDTFFEPV